MRVIVQRVKEASVTINGSVYNSIGKGYLLLVGITHDDNEEIVRKVAKKVVDLRIFEDENDKMNLGIQDVNGSILSISQFTLYASVKKGRRPSFTDAARPDVASALYDKFNEILNESVECKTGIFQTDMKVSLINDGPVTIIVDSKEL